MSTYIIIVIVSLVFSAFFSGMEIAFVSSNKLKLEIEKKQNSVYNYIVTHFLNSPGQYIATILVGNNIALVIYSIYMSGLIQRLIGSEIYLVETIVSTIVILFTAEFIPKVVFKVNSNMYLKIFAVPVFFFYLLFYPISKFTTLLSALILRVFGIKINKNEEFGGFNKIDIANLLEEASEKQTEHQHDNDIKILQNALDFSDLRARECMIPRIDIEAVDIESSVEDLAEVAIKTGFTRLPVYEGNIDNVIGYVSNRDLFSNPQSIREMLRQIDFVPESMSVQKLLATLTKGRRSMAIVIDEFGGTSGMITLEDILEEIFGEIEDEHDSDNMVEKKINDNQYILSGRLEVDYINETYDIGIPESDEYETLAGFIIYHNESIPSQGEIIEVGKLRLRIVRTSSTRIELVHLTLL